MHKRKTSKTLYTATHINARYIGNHPYLKDTEGVYFYNNKQESYVYRPNTGKGSGDWFRTDRYKLEEFSA